VTAPLVSSAGFNDLPGGLHLRTVPTLLSLLLLCFGLTGCELGFWNFDEQAGDVLADDDDERDEEVEDDDDVVSDDDDDDAASDDDDAVEPDDDDAQPLGEDADGDGFSADEDCDDYNAAVHPGASEVACDGEDNDCDGQFLPEDLDGDGDGYSPCLGDCDDSDAATGVNGVEIECDGVDQDCSGADLCDPVDPEPDPDPDPDPDPVPAPSGSVCDGALTYGAGGDPWVAGDLDPGDPIYGSTGSWYYETWSVAVPTGGTWYVDLYSSDFDAWVEVYDAGCNFVGSDDDGCGFGSDACYDYAAVGGEQIYVLASSYDELATGSYSLEVW